jgi:glycerol-3-phosphate dehydrogenase
MASGPNQMKTRVLIIGGGITGAGIARDLALRGVDCILVERRDICAGASGANHGLLHSGARYVRSDPEAARECRREGDLLKALAPHCIEETGGLFVAVEGDDEQYAAEFPDHCRACGIPVTPLDVREAREMEPALSEKLRAAFLVEDASVDPFRLAMDNLSEAVLRGSRVLTYREVAGFDIDEGQIRAVRLVDPRSGSEAGIEAEIVVNAAGAWGREVAALAGVVIEMLYSKGSLLITDQRLTERVINRLRKASDADILVPGGTVSILGTTSVRIDSLADIRPTVAELSHIVDTAAAMIPELAETRYIRSYAGVRPLFGSSSLEDGRALSRGFAVLDHAVDGVGNLISIVGGKLTTYRLMAEKTADLVCERLGVRQPCRTHRDPLKPDPANQWTAPGLAPKIWLRQQDPEDLLLCECEMVPTSAVDAIVAALQGEDRKADLYAIGRRSRIGKGTCQGAFCGIRILTHLCDRHGLSGRQGLVDLKQFLTGRWRGMRPLLWGPALVQEELQEALHCGFFGLELQDPDPVDR